MLMTNNIRVYVCGVLARPGFILALLGGFNCFSTSRLPAVELSLGDRAKSVAQKTSDAVKEAGNSAADKIKYLWRRVDSARLENRRRDEIVAWVIMGVLVG